MYQPTMDQTPESDKQDERVRQHLNDLLRLVAREVVRRLVEVDDAAKRPESTNNHLPQSST